jgi:hypothetical protein
MLDRREFVSLSALLAAVDYAPRALTPAEFAAAEEFVELIVPGAKAARVMRYIDLGLAHGVGDAAAWKRGTAAWLRGKVPMADLAAAELKPATELERFFGTAKRAAIEAYALSDEGQKEWLGYRGGVHLTSFPGCTEEHG